MFSVSTLPFHFLQTFILLFSILSVYSWVSFNHIVGIKSFFLFYCPFLSECCFVLRYIDVFLVILFLYIDCIDIYRKYIVRCCLSWRSLNVFWSQQKLLKLCRKSLDNLVHLIFIRLYVFKLVILWTSSSILHISWLSLFLSLSLSLCLFVSFDWSSRTTVLSPYHHCEIWNIRIKVSLSRTPTSHLLRENNDIYKDTQT